ncbi:MAG: lyase family protein [Cloacibacillus evryensis]
MWKGRFAQDTDEAVINFTQSLDLDWRMAFADIRGSVAHVRMLAHTGLLDAKEAETIEENLRGIAEEIRSGDFTPKVSLEDVHMNIERLIEKAAPPARASTGRSRNDQVNTKALYLRKELLGIWEGLESLISVLSKRPKSRPTSSFRLHAPSAGAADIDEFPLAHARALCATRSACLPPMTRRRIAARLRRAAGSTLPLDREFTRADMGFSPYGKSMDTVAHRPFMTSSTSPRSSEATSAAFQRTLSSTSRLNSAG